MKIIDAHLHFSNIESFKRTAKELSFIDYSSQGLAKEFRESNVVIGIAMGLTEKSLGGFPDYETVNPMGLDLENSIPDSVFYCLGINPMRFHGKDREEELKNIEIQLSSNRVVGIKIYAGYYPYHVYDPIYQPIYDLAARHNIPVVIHSGDTYSERGLLKYSHPLNVDELAVSRRDINFVICHFGDPWVMDTAEIISKNYNVYADLSGLLVGDYRKVEKFKNERLFFEHIQRAIIYANNYKKFLFGTDWPLVQIKPYVDFVKALIPEEFHEDVFYNNALEVFSRLKQVKI